MRNAIEVRGQPKTAEQSTLKEDYCAVTWKSSARFKMSEKQWQNIFRIILRVEEYWDLIGMQSDNVSDFIFWIGIQAKAV